MGHPRRRVQRISTVGGSGRAVGTMLTKTMIGATVSRHAAEAAVVVASPRVAFWGRAPPHRPSDLSSPLLRAGELRSDGADRRIQDGRPSVGSDPEAGSGRGSRHPQRRANTANTSGSIGARASGSGRGGPIGRTIKPRGTTRESALAEASMDHTMSPSSGRRCSCHAEPDSGRSLPLDELIGALCAQRPPAERSRPAARRPLESTGEHLSERVRWSSGLRSGEDASRLRGPSAPRA